MLYDWKIIGHQKKLALLEHDIGSGNLAHAYLFSGPDHVGKYTVAKNLAHILQCEKGFCHVCPTCLQIEKGSHIDTMEFRDALGESVKIEEVRTLLQRLYMSPQAKYKIVLIENIERATMESFNGLLKILEEPPPSTLFLFTTLRLHAVPSTVLSRVRHMKFHHFSDVYLKTCLADRFPDAVEETIAQASLFAFGKSGKALQLVEHPEQLQYYRTLYHELEHFSRYPSLVEKFKYIAELIGEEDKEKMSDVLNVMLHIIRSRALNEPQRTMESLTLTRAIYRTARALKQNVNARFALEQLFLQW